MPAPPTLTPVATTPINVLPETGSFGVASNVETYSKGIYADPTSDLYDTNFISGAVDQIRYTYRMCGGSHHNVELSEQDVCESYEAAVLEYSSIINLWQAKNALPSALGQVTASFDHDGQITSSNSGSNYALKYPKWDFSITRRVSRKYSTETGVGGDVTFFSASIPLTPGRQSYDLQLIVSASAASGNVDYASVLGNNRIEVKTVYYKSPSTMWRFFGYYGGLNAVGNLSNYGMYSDDSTFEVIPVWQNKLQAIAYEDAVWTRNSHYQYDIRNNKIRLFPTPQTASPDNLWIEFIVPTGPWDEDTGTAGSQSVANAGDVGAVDGVNNINTMPFSNIPFQNINGYGKHWIRRYALAISRGILSETRGKWTDGVPLPNDRVNLNWAQQLERSEREREALRSELVDMLDQTQYKNVARDQAELVESVDRVVDKVPLGIYVG